MATSPSTEASPITTHRLESGMAVLVQPMPWVRTAAMTLALRGGIQYEQESHAGLASMVCEMVQRGAGSFNSRDLVAVQDNLGIDRNCGVSTATVSFGAAMPAESLERAISIYADVVRRPHLPADQIDDARMMMIQELRAIEDEPTQRVMRRVREMHYGPRLGRGNQGNMESLQAISNQEVQRFFESRYQAGGSILSVAGAVDVANVVDWAETAFGDWQSTADDDSPHPQGVAGYEHFEADSSQTHIAFAFERVPYGHPDYFRMRAGVGILSDGMSSRLFDRVREKRGLCYTVSASCHSLVNAGGVFGYAGTKPERAQETLDVTLHEIEHLIDDLAQQELDRWKVRIESGLIMEQESSASRAGSLASDFYQLGRALTTDELSHQIEAITLESVRSYWEEHPPTGYRIVTLGEQPLRCQA